MSEICMMSLTRDEVAERKDYDAIKVSFDDLWSSINSNENANVSVCTIVFLWIENSSSTTSSLVWIRRKDMYRAE
ncbi:hypothetical protein [Vibrio chagasii]|uniref:hypothetical protein n=1 Tax=Vibrio chagasii TaxID=170679 RepID=UPI002157392F|nr:hypothetical protein [Vibrio chagasii]